MALSADNFKPPPGFIFCRVEKKNRMQIVREERKHSSLTIRLITYSEA